MVNIWTIAEDIRQRLNELEQPESTPPDDAEADEHAALTALEQVLDKLGY